MLFVAVLLIATGYTFMYAGVKGDAYKIGGHAVWKEPWLPFLAVFTGQGSKVTTDATTPAATESWYSSALAQAAAAQAAPPANASPQVTTPGPSGVTLA